MSFDATSPGSPTPTPQGGPDRRNTTLAVIIGVAVVLTAGIVAAAILSTNADGHPSGSATAGTPGADTSPPGSSTPTGQTVRLEPAATTTNPFVTTVAVTAETLPNPAQATIATVRAGWPADPVTGVPTVDGSTPGLYIGDPGHPDCHPGDLTAALTTNPAVAAAFAAAARISSSQIGPYLGTLTPVLLGSDSWVTDHDLIDGQAVPVPAVLQAGTAVLINTAGEPTIRCAGGTPLTKTGPSRFADQLAIGTPWPGYTPTTVITIRPGTPTNQLTLISLTTGKTYNQSLVTDPPAQSRTTPPPAGAPTTVTVTTMATAHALSPGDLGLTKAMTRPACDGTGIVLLFASVTPGAYAQEIQQALDTYPGSAYLRTDQACSSLNQATSSGDPIYAVYRIAGHDPTQVCAAVNAAGGSAYGKWLDNTTNPDSQIAC